MVCLVVGIDSGLFKLLDCRTCLKGIFHISPGCQEGILGETLSCLVQAGFLCCLKCCLYSDFAFSNVPVANTHIFHNDAENVVIISCSGARAAVPTLPWCGCKADSVAVLPRLQSKSRRTFKPWRPIIQPHYAFLQYHFLSSSHLKRLQLRSTYTSPSGLKKVQLSLLKVWLLVDASINPEGRIAILQIPGSICMCWWLQNWKKKGLIILRQVSLSSGYWLFVCGERFGKFNQRSCAKDS